MAGFVPFGAHNRRLEASRHGAHRRHGPFRIGVMHGDTYGRNRGVV